MSRILAIGIILCCGWAGCALHRGQSVTSLPVKHTVRTPRVIVHSDIPIGEDSSLVQELGELRIDILSTLALPEPKRPVVLYLFSDEERYSSYMKANFPKLPTRRAFFIGSPGELAVYAFHGEHLAVDLRHEYTHGVLHAALPNVPLWLDEGLAEYFETERGGQRINEEHRGRLTAAIKGGWKPDLVRLEQLTDVSEMQALDYHEAWAWIYTWLQGEDQQRQELIAYVHRLKQPAATGRLSQALISQADSVERVQHQIAMLDTSSHQPGQAHVKGHGQEIEQAAFETVDTAPATAPEAARPFPELAPE